MPEPESKNPGNNEVEPVSVAPAAAPETQAEAPKTPEARAEMARSLGDQATQKPAENGENALEEELPDNKWSQTYYQLKKELEADPTKRGPMTEAFLAILLIAAKYYKFADVVPGAFLTRLNEDEDVKDKKFSDEEAKKLLAAKRDEAREKAALEATKAYIEEQKQAGKKIGMEKASTRYACSALWGITDIDDASTLAAKLLHTSKGTADANFPLYRQSTLASLKKQGMPFGTVLIFVPKINADKAVAYATGNADEIKYFDTAKNAEVTIKLSDVGSPILSEFSLLAAFVPKFNSDPAYFEKHQDELDAGLATATSTETSNENPQTKAARELAETERGKFATLSGSLVALMDELGKGNESDMAKSIAREELLKTIEAGDAALKAFQEYLKVAEDAKKTEINSTIASFERDLATLKEKLDVLS